jgi:putative membrane protein
MLDRVSFKAMCGVLPCTLIVVFFGFIAGTILATFFPVLRLIFISKQEMQEEVQRKAAEAFHHFRIRNTEGETGVLIYVSLYEHMVRVMGDDKISEKLIQADWDEVCTLVVKGMKSGTPHEGLEKAIIRCGQLLSEHFPKLRNDKNELSNELQLID